MKHVLVLYSHNLSADYLASHDLKDGFAPNFDSRNAFVSSEYAATVNGGLQTQDHTIQFHHFKHRQPRSVERLEEDPTPNDIEYWVEK